MNERYELRGIIAEGGLGTVHRAWDKNLDREVAIKRVRAAAAGDVVVKMKSLLKEARTLSTLQHPNIVTVYDAGEDDEGAFIVMELVKGETLDQIIARGALTEKDFEQLAVQTLEGLIAAHDLGLIHLDLKPENLMITWHASGRFQVKILDFGIAKNFQEPVRQEEDERGAVLGSIHFMAPEQFERAALDQRTDIYALGCICYFALTQQYPFQGDTGPQVMVSHLYHRSAPLAQLRPDLNPEICQWVEWLINRRPPDRPENAKAALEALPRRAETANVTPVSVEPVAVVVEDVPPKPATAKKLVTGKTTAKLSMPPPGGTATRRPAPAPLPQPAAKGFPKWAIYTLPPILVLILGFGTLRVIQFMREKEREERFATLVNDEKPEANDADVRMLFSFLERKETTAPAATALMKIEGGDYIDEMIAQHLDKAQSIEARANLLKVAGLRGIHAALPAAMSALGAENENVRKSAWTAVGMIGKPEHLPELLEKMSGSKEPQFAEQTLVSIATAEGAGEKGADEIVRAYRSGLGGASHRAALIRVLGQTGGEKAFGVLEEALSSATVDLRKAAATTLGLWTRNDALKLIATRFPQETDPAVRLIALASAVNIATQSGSLPQSAVFALAKKLHDAAKDQREKDQAVATIARVLDPDAAAFFDALAISEPARKNASEATGKRIRENLERVISISGETALMPEQADFSKIGGLTVSGGVLTNWLMLSDYAAWDVRIEQAGEHEVSISQASSASKDGKYEIVLAGVRLETSVVKTGDVSTFKSFIVGKINITEPGIYRLWLKPTVIPDNEPLFRVQSLSLKKL
jgi:HEAT repeat protein